MPSLLWASKSSASARATAPTVSSPWKQTWDGGWQPVITSEAEFTGSYTSPAGQAVNVFVHRYALNANGVELASGSNPLLAGSDATVWAQRRRSIVLNGHPAAVNENVALVGRTTRRLIWSWYTVAGTSTPDVYRVKLLQAKARLFDANAQGQLTVISIRLQDLTADRNLLQEFLNSAGF